MAYIDPRRPYDPVDNPGDGYASIAPSGPGTPSGTSQGPSNPYAPFFGQGAGIAGAYKKYLGRDISGSLDENDSSKLGEYQSWLGNQNYEEGIKNSGEAQDYARRMAAPSGGGGNGAIAPSGAYVPPPAPSGGGATYGGTSVFDDPATKNFEALLNERIKQLQTPFQNPDYQPAVDQMRGYLSRLNGPVYTEGQRDLMQTQALDPLERQRQAARQQVIQRLSARGIGPSSGIVEKALEDVDNQFNQIRTKTQAGFAMGEIDQGNRNAAMAAQFAPMIAQMQQQNFGLQDARSGQAVNMAQTIPNMAWSRLTGANNAIQPLNAGQLFSQMQGYQNQGYGQDTAFMQSLIPILMSLFGGG